MTEPIGSGAGNVVRFGLAPRLAGLTTAQFVQLWADHGARSRRSGRPGRLAYVQNFPVLEGGRHLLPYPGFDVCAEATYESMAAVEAAFAPGAPVGLHADRATLMDESGFAAVTAERHVLRAGAVPDTAVKLMFFYRAHPLHGADALFARLGSEHARIAGRGPLLQYELLLANSPEPRPCDAVEILWFPSAVDALAYARSELAYAAGIALGGRCFGTERLIARPVSG
jgi:hypothetical protein